MTSAQAPYLKTLYEEAGETPNFEPGLNKAEDSKRIDQMRRRARRGTSGQ